MMDGDRGKEDRLTRGKRDKPRIGIKKKERQVVYRTTVCYCPLLLHYVTIFLSLRLCCSRFPLALSPILVLILSFPVCQFVKAPHHYCQKSHCGANTKATRKISHIQAHALVLAAHSCVERERVFFFFSHWVLTLSSKPVPLES